MCNVCVFMIGVCVCGEVSFKCTITNMPFTGKFAFSLYNLLYLLHHHFYMHNRVLFFMPQCNNLYQCKLYFDTRHYITLVCESLGFVCVMSVDDVTATEDLWVCVCMCASVCVHVLGTRTFCGRFFGKNRLLLLMGHNRFACAWCGIT